jgi:ferric-dicitrate binding protein FerR (iron transport regulator)
MVQSGHVILADRNGEQEIVLDPDLIGTLGSTTNSRYRNSDPNYLSWSTEVLTYEGTPLEKTFNDLKRVHNIEVIATDNSILDKRISTTFDRQSPETIISIICTTFNLESEISNSIYYLSEK